MTKLELLGSLNPVHSQPNALSNMVTGLTSFGVSYQRAVGPTVLDNPTFFEIRGSSLTNRGKCAHVLLQYNNII